MRGKIRKAMGTVPTEAPDAMQSAIDKANAAHYTDSMPKAPARPPAQDDPPIRVNIKSSPKHVPSPETMAKFRDMTDGEWKDFADATSSESAEWLAGPPSQLDRIEAKLDRLIAKYVKD